MKQLLGFCILSAAVVLTGCGSGKVKRASVKGKVTVGGKSALPGGSIQFALLPDAKVVGGGQINPDGTYMVADAPVGECRVTVDNWHLEKGGRIGNMGPTGGAAPKGVAVPPGPTTQETGKERKYVKIDPAYAAEKSPLKATINSGENSHDFDVK